MANEYLKRTPTSTGNRKVFTWSSWLKKDEINTPARLLGNYSAGTTQSAIQFGYRNGSSTDGAIRLFNIISGTTDALFEFDPLFRDYSSWFHLLLSVNTTLGNADDRIIFYINGVRQKPFTSTYVASGQNSEFSFNTPLSTNGPPTIGSAGGNGEYWEGEICDVFWVDGQALTPEVFGFYKDGNGYISAGSTQSTDFRNGQWVPRTPREIKNLINDNGGFGVNGFYLPMNDSSNFGADFHTTPNSIIKLQEDLSQPKVSIASTAQAGLGYTDVLRADPYAANLVLAIPFVNSGLCTDGTNSGISTGFGDYSHIINTSQTAKDVQLITYNGTTPTIVSYASSSTNYYGSACYIDGNGSAHAGGHIRVVDDNIFDDLNLTTANWTIEGWFNPASRSTGGSNLFNFGDATDYNQIQVILDPSGDIWHLWSYTGSAWNVNDAGTTARPPVNQWSHIAFEKVGTGTTSHITTYVNGVAAKVTAVPQDINYSSNPRLILGGHYLSGASGGDTYYYDGLVSDVRMYNVAKYKGGFDVPKPYTPVGIGTWRAVSDTCKNNFATLNPLHIGDDTGNNTYTNGNLKAVASSNNQITSGNMGVSSGKWYWETHLYKDEMVGIFEADGQEPGQYPGQNAYGVSYHFGGGVYQNGSTSYGLGWASEVYQIVGCALDVDNKRLYWHVNGVWANEADPETENGYWDYSKDDSGVSYVDTATHVVPGWRTRSATVGEQVSVNFGQNPTFGGEISLGVTYPDSNGIGQFKYQPPSGYLAICSSNLPEPGVKNPGENFKTLLWEGDGVKGRAITGLGFKPDLIWTYERTSTSAPYITDSTIGNEFWVATHAGQSQGSSGNWLQSFDDDGFTLGSDGAMNQDGQTHIGWCWKAGGQQTTTNSDGSIMSEVSVNDDAGFSIISWESVGSNTTTRTVGHGLSSKPDFILLKNRDASVNWRVYHHKLGTDALTLNVTEAAYSFWPSEPTDSVITLANSTTTGEASGYANDTISAYCWREIEGYSKFGRFVGNEDADGPFVYLGFKPALIVIKCDSTASNWGVFDSSRHSTNPHSTDVYWNLSDTEYTSNVGPDFLSNGFKMRTTNTTWNGDGKTYVYAAWAETPFKYANAK